jgi:hypothetical protein
MRLQPPEPAKRPSLALKVRYGARSAAGTATGWPFSAVSRQSGPASAAGVPLPAMPPPTGSSMSSAVGAAPCVSTR